MALLWKRDQTALGFRQGSRCSAHPKSWQLTWACAYYIATSGWTARRPGDVFGMVGHGHWVDHCNSYQRSTNIYYSICSDLRYSMCGLFGDFAVNILLHSLQSSRFDASLNVNRLAYMQGDYLHVPGLKNATLAKARLTKCGDSHPDFTILMYKLNSFLKGGVSSCACAEKHGLTRTYLPLLRPASYPCALLSSRC